jgi:hypothetical protein
MMKSFRDRTRDRVRLSPMHAGGIRDASALFSAWKPLQAIQRSEMGQLVPSASHLPGLNLHLTKTRLNDALSLCKKFCWTWNQQGMARCVLAR